jgi:TolB-like protein/Tfp pilus assembly protein PilF
MSRLAALLHVVNERKVLRSAAIYVSTSLTALGMVNLFSTHYSLSSTIFDVVLIVLLFGLPAVIVAAWRHAGAAQGSFHALEIGFYVCLTLLAGTSLYHVVGTPRRIEPGPSIRSLAVLPFTNMSEVKEDEFFSDGITEDILTQLSKIADLNVISRASVLPYKGTHKTVAEVGNELGVGALLTGSVRRAGNRVRIVAELADVRTANRLWSETYDREMKDIFAIQSDVARAIAAELKARLSPDVQARLGRPSTQNLEAYALYLQGREQYNHYRQEDNEQALTLFSRALALDPRYALAYAGVSDVYSQRVQKFGYPERWLDSAVAAARTAIALDPGTAEAYKALGVVYAVRHRFRDALEQYKTALALNPSYAPAVANIGTIYWWLGAYDESLPWTKKNVLLNPTLAYGFRRLGFVYLSLAMDSAARHWFTAALALQPSLTIARGDLVSLALAQSDTAKARALAAAFLAECPDDRFALTAAGDAALFTGRLAEAKPYYERADAKAEIAYCLWAAGRRAEAKERFSAIIRDDEKQVIIGNEEFSPAWELARVYAAQGINDQALHWLQKAIDMGFRDYRWCAIDPLMQGLRTSTEFTRTLERLSAAVAQMRERVEKPS